MPEALPAPGTPEWWVTRLNDQLDRRQRLLETYNAYYVGNHPLPEAPERAKGAFRRWMRLSRSNWMALVVDAVAERLAVQGIRYGQDQSADDDAWSIWQANGLDVASDTVHLEALINGTSYVIVGPNTDDPRRPFITPAHPTQTIVANDAATRTTRQAAFRKWVDDLTGRAHAVLYLPDFVYKLQSVRPLPSYTAGVKITWEPRDIPNEQWPLPNALGVVPVVPFDNRPRMLSGGVSEIDGVTDTQDRINETLFMRVMAGQYSAFRQRYAVGLDLEFDDESGLPKKPFEPGAAELWVATNPEARFGDFQETNLAGYLDSIAADVQHIAAQTHTPPHYLLGQMVNLAAEALKAAEAGLVSKVRRRQTVFGEAWEEVWRLAFLASGDATKASITDAEVIWRNPEFRTEGQLVDALTKMATLGVPQEVLWEKWGASPQEITRWKAIQAETALSAAIFDPFSTQAPLANDVTALPISTEASDASLPTQP